MEIQGVPREQRAEHLLKRLQPKSLLQSLETATHPGRQFVTLVGIKAGQTDKEEFERDYVPEYKTFIRDDPEIQSILQPYRDMGFAFVWSGYSDPTGVEVTLAIKRNADAEARLRALADSE